jgi:hypothetical protein
MAAGYRVEAREIVDIRTKTVVSTGLIMRLCSYSGRRSD